MHRWLVLALVCILVPLNVHSKESDVDVTFSMKAGGGGEFWSQPSNTTVVPDLNQSGEQFDFPLFADARGGYNYSMGFFGQLRVIRHFGIEVGFVMTHRTFIEQTTFTYHDVTNSDIDTTKFDERVHWAVYRIPIMAKFLVPVSKSLVWVGAGVEFSYGRYANTVFDKMSGEDLQGKRKDFKYLLAQEQDDLYLTFGVGTEVWGSPNFRVPIELRFGYNFRQPSNYYDRAVFDALPNANPTRVDGKDVYPYPSSMTIKARDSWYGEVLIGISYDLY